MQNGEFNHKTRVLFFRIMIIIGIGLFTVSCTRTKMVSFQSHNIETQYPESWSVEDYAEGFLLHPSQEGIDAGVMILPNPRKYMEENLQHSLEKYLSSEFLPSLKEVLTTNPVEEYDFNGYPAAKGQVVANMARSEGATYALQFDLFLVEHEDERALIIMHQRGGLETINEDFAEDLESILRSFQFQEN